MIPSVQVDCFADAPWLVSLIMSNGFKSPLGSLTVAPWHYFRTSDRQIPSRFGVE